MPRTLAAGGFVVAVEERDLKRKRRKRTKPRKELLSLFSLSLSLSLPLFRKAKRRVGVEEETSIFFFFFWVFKTNSSLLAFGVSDRVDKIEAALTWGTKYPWTWRRGKQVETLTAPASRVQTYPP